MCRQIAQKLDLPEKLVIECYKDYWRTVKKIITSKRYSRITDINEFPEETDVRVPMLGVIRTWNKQLIVDYNKANNERYKTQEDSANVQQDSADS